MARIELTLNNSRGGFSGLYRIPNLLSTGRSGRSFLGALYTFADELKDPNDRAAAKLGLLNALAESSVGGTTVCPDGISQRLITSVLQGRVSYVTIDDQAAMTDADVSVMFFTPGRQKMDATQLRGALEEFVALNPGVDRAQLTRIVDGYIEMLGE